jgi:hypothetical protein
MNRAQLTNNAEAISFAIWLRDKSEGMGQDELINNIVQLSAFSVFSSRQIASVVSHRASHSLISKIIKKKDKTGGNLNVDTLEVLRAILYSRSDGKADYELISEALEKGTSQGMISRLTGISQSSISRRLGKNG